MRAGVPFLSPPLSGAALLVSFLFPGALPIDPAWLSILLCGIPHRPSKGRREGLYYPL